MIAAWWRALRCQHPNLRTIYGDEIIFATPDYSRHQCLDCGRYSAHFKKD